MRWHLHPGLLFWPAVLFCHERYVRVCADRPVFKLIAEAPSEDLPVAKKEEVAEFLGDAGAADRPSLCDHDVVSQVCGWIDEADGQKDEPRDYVTLKEVRLALSATSASVSRFLKHIKVCEDATTKGTNSSEERACEPATVACEDFCRKTIAAVPQNLLPGATDVGCRAGLADLGESEVVCDVDLSEKALRRLTTPKVENMRNMHDREDELGQNASKSSKLQALGFDLLDFTDKQMVRKVCNLFRVYPLLSTSSLHEDKPNDPNYGDADPQALAQQSLASHGTSARRFHSNSHLLASGGVWTTTADPTEAAMDWLSDWCLWLVGKGWLWGVESKEAPASTTSAPSTTRELPVVVIPTPPRARPCNESLCNTDWSTSCRESYPQFLDCESCATCTKLRVDLEVGQRVEAYFATKEGKSDLSENGKIEKLIGGIGGVDVIFDDGVRQTLPIAYIVRVLNNKTDGEASVPKALPRSSSLSADLRKMVAVRSLQAQADVSTVIRKVSSHATGPSMRKWFGKDAFDSEGARAEIRRVLNSLDRMLSHADFIYPGPLCRDNTFAYVQPRSVFAKNDRGEFVFFLCPLFMRSSAPVQIETLTHEGSHHSVAFTDDMCVDGNTECADNKRAYGRKICEQLAEVAPTVAVKNADNFCYYINDVCER